MAKQFHSGMGDIFKVCAHGALKDTLLGKKVLISLLLNHISWKQLIFWRRKILALNGSLGPSSESIMSTDVGTTEPSVALWRNTNSTNFYWWQEQKFYNLLTLCILCIKTSTSSYFEVSGPANCKGVSFPILIVVTTWIPHRKDAGTHPRIKNKCQTKSEKSAVRWDPLTISNIINHPKPTRATTSILKLGNYDLHCNLRTTILISIIIQ